MVINRREKIVIMSACFILLSAMSVIAAPTINSTSGFFTAGAVAQVTGSSFGNMNGNIVSWDNFENQANGQNIANSSPVIGPTWTCIYGYNGDYAQFDNTQPHSGTRAAHLDWSGTDGIRAFGWSGQGPFNKLYITYWRYMVGNYNPSTTNHKQFYLYGNANQMPQSMPFIPGGETVWGFYNNNSTSQGGWSGTNNINSKGWTYSNTSNQYQRWEYWLVLNSPQASANGILKVWLDGQIGIDRSDYRHRIENTGEWIDFRLGHMANGFTDSAEAWFDDLYIATTQARVEIGNASTWAACTHREIQVAKSWADGSIQFTINQGSFTNGSSAYLYVVDSNGVINANGYSIIIGGGSSSDNIPPVNPKGVTAITLP